MLIWLCLRHQLLPFRVGQSPWLDTSAPSLRLLSQPSSLLRADPSLHLASVLSRLRASLFPLQFSLGIQVLGSHVLHSRLDPSSRRLYAGHRLGRTQVPPRLCPGPSYEARFRWHLRFVFDTLSAVHLRSSSGTSPAELDTRLFHRRSPHELLPSCSSGRFGAWSCYPTPRGLPSSAVQHVASSSLSFSNFVAHTGTQTYVDSS